ncbi:hypothetical protein BU17DRAFT_85317 [Hysterangium stoloniferum]|nr:hypothetical protein BU17DRAFT_85317 [Hysterangium stoloniferum]
MSNRSQLPPDTQRSSCSQSANESEEKRQDRAVLEDDTIALNLQGIQSGVINFELPFAVVLLSQIAETANPPLLPGLKNIDYVHKCIVENDALFHLLGECLQKESFSEIRSLEILQPVSGPHLRYHKLLTLSEILQTPPHSRKNTKFCGEAARTLGVSRTSIGQQFVEAKYVSRSLEAFKFYMNQCFQRFLSAREDNKPYYGLHLSIVQSSGTGKSRLISELGRNDVFVVHMTLRDRTDKGFPPRDDIPANLLADKKANNSREPAKDAGLAFSGKEVMTDAYKSLVHVIKGLLPKVIAGGTDPEMKVMLGFDEASILGDEQGWPEKFIPADIIVVRSAYILTGIDTQFGRFSLQLIRESRISGLQGKLTKRYMLTFADPSLRVPVGGKLLFRPFTELSFDQSAPKFSLDSGNWPVLNDANHICGFGRPLWSTMNACTSISELVAVAKWKLMLAHGYDNTRAACSLALVFQRLALDVVFGHLQTVKYLETSVASHMRICISVTEDRSWKETCYPSEPLLSHVTADVMWEWDHVLPDVLFHLKNHIESGMIDVGKNGELVCRLLLLFAKDHCLSRSSTGIFFMDTPEVENGHLRYCSAIPVNEWLTRLFGKKAWATDMEQNVRARQTFNDYEVNFLHWVSMKENIAPFDGGVTADEFAKRLYFRTSAVQCADRQPLIDQLIIIRKKGTNDFSHVCISDKDGGTQDQADVSYIQRTGIDLENGLPWIAICMDVGVKKTGFSSTFFDSDSTQQHNAPCLRIWAGSMDRGTYPFLNQGLESAMKWVLHRSILPPEAECASALDGLRSEVLFGQTSGEQWR